MPTTKYCSSHSIDAQWGHYIWFDFYGSISNGILSFFKKRFGFLKVWISHCAACLVAASAQNKWIHNWPQCEQMWSETVMTVINNFTNGDERTVCFSKVYSKMTIILLLCFLCSTGNWSFRFPKGYWFRLDAAASSSSPGKNAFMQKSATPKKEGKRKVHQEATLIFSPNTGCTWGQFGTNFPTDKSAQQFLFWPPSTQELSGHMVTPKLFFQLKGCKFSKSLGFFSAGDGHSCE